MNKCITDKNVTALLTLTTNSEINMKIRGENTTFRFSKNPELDNYELYDINNKYDKNREFISKECIYGLSCNSILEVIGILIQDYATEIIDDIEYVKEIEKEEQKEDLKVGDRVFLSGAADELWIEDYGLTRVESNATVLQTPNPKDKKVLLNIDYIDHESNVNALVKKDKIIRNKVLDSEIDLD